MDIALDFADEYILDDLYARFFPLVQANLASGKNGTLISHVSYLSRDNIYRQFASLLIITMIFVYFFYFFFSTLSYIFVFDKDLMKHPKFLKNQIAKEIKLSASGFPITSIVTVPWFLGEVRGYSALYDDINQYGIIYAIFSVFWFLFFTDMCIYWVHRWLHHPLIYKRLHKAHHRWIVPTPYSSHAFHPLDGYLQSVPYHISVYLFPLHKYIYISLFVFVNLWTIMIHDGEFLTSGSFVNGAAHHVLHHLYFNYNYGQYFTIWDKIGGSYRKPGDEQFDIKKKKDQNIWQKQAREVDSLDENGKEKKA